MVKRSREDFDSIGNPEDLADSQTPTDGNQKTDQEVETKIVHLDAATDGPQAEVMKCSLPGHRPELPFTSYEEYEVHYNKSHVNRCVECRRNFPTRHFLNLHQSENHDPLMAVRKDRGDKTYACFVEDCDKKCSTWQKRRLHLIDKHMFPQNYDFAVVKTGIDRKTSMLKQERQRRRSLTFQRKNQDARTSPADASIMDTDLNLSVKDTESQIKPNQESLEDSQKVVSNTATAPKVNETKVEAMEIDDLAGAMSALRFVPPSIRFGKGKSRPGFSKS